MIWQIYLLDYNFLNLNINIFIYFFLIIDFLFQFLYSLVLLNLTNLKSGNNDNIIDFFILDFQIFFY